MRPLQGLGLSGFVCAVIIQDTRTRAGPCAGLLRCSGSTGQRGAPVHSVHPAAVFVQRRRSINELLVRCNIVTV